MTESTKVQRADLRAPFPWFGGKSRAAPIVWEAIGNVPNYVEPFFGSGAVLLARPHDARTETVNDKSAFLANFWRALQSDPAGVAKACDWPVNETDMHARHKWLLSALPELAARLDGNPEYFDVRIAGWWVWGACAWIGSGWCDEGGGSPAVQMPHVGDAGMGVHRKLPHVGDAGRGVDGLTEYLSTLASRLRRVRVACGDWSRVCGDSVTWRHGTTGVFLDPPYAEGEQQYAAGGTGTTLSADVRNWAIEMGERRDMRIVLAGLDGEHAMPSTWRCVPWKARGGYGSQRQDGENMNRHRERLWISPHCECATQPSLFGVP
jgi:DNA adenine methylase